MDDTIDKNPVHEYGDSIEYVNSMLTRIESYRTKYRHLELKTRSHIQGQDGADNDKEVNRRLDVINADMNKLKCV